MRLHVRILTVSSLVAAGIAAGAANGRSDDEPGCAPGGGREAVDVIGLETVEHREITADDAGSRYLPTRRVAGPVHRADYVLRVVVDTERRHEGLEHPTRAAEDVVGAGCRGVLRQFSDETLSDFDITSSAGAGSDHPAGTSLKDLFDVSVELVLKDGIVPAGVFDPRNAQTLALYVDRDPKQPLVLNLRPNRAFDGHSAHVFGVVMSTADGNAYAARSEPVVLLP